MLVVNFQQDSFLYSFLKREQQQQRQSPYKAVKGKMMDDLPLHPPTKLLILKFGIGDRQTPQQQQQQQLLTTSPPPRYSSSSHRQQRKRPKTILLFLFLFPQKQKILFWNGTTCLRVGQSDWRKNENPPCFSDESYHLTWTCNRVLLLAALDDASSQWGTWLDSKKWDLDKT